MLAVDFKLVVKVTNYKGFDSKSIIGQTKADVSSHYINQNDTNDVANRVRLYLCAILCIFD